MRLFSIFREFQDSSTVQNVFRPPMSLFSHGSINIQIQSSSSSKTPFSIWSFFFFPPPMYPLVSVLNILPSSRHFPTSLHSFGTVEMTSRWSKGVKVRLNVYRKAGGRGGADQVCVGEGLLITNLFTDPPLLQLCP